MVELRQEVSQLRLVGLEELTPHGHIKEQVADLDVRSYGAGTHFLAHHVRTVYLDQRSGFVFGAAGGHLHLCHRADRSQGFAAETHRAEREQILRFAYLTRRMTLERQTGVHLTHANTIINHLQQRPSGVTNDHLDTGCPRVQTVLHQLFQTRRRALDHLACRNLVRYAVR